MQNTVDDTLTNSKVAKTKSKFKKFDLEDLINDIISTLIMDIESNNAIITHDPMPCIKTDKSQIVHLFKNLIFNAIKFHENEPPEIHISAKKDDNRWIFKLEDYPNTDIGLSVFQKIVKNHNGLLCIKSKPGKGSKLLFTLPV